MAFLCLSKGSPSSFSSSVVAARPNLLHFGDVAVGEARVLTFSMSNHARDSSVRFVWPELPELRVSPAVGHIHPGRTKDLTLTFTSQVGTRPIVGHPPLSSTGLLVS